MKHCYLFFIAFFFVHLASAQCIFSGSDNHLTEATIEACLNASACGVGGSNCTVTFTNGSYDVESGIDLTDYPGLTFIIASDANVNFFDQGSNTGDLLLDATSSIVVESGGDLTTNNSGSVQITIGATTYTGAQFPDIINAGGADANGVLPIELIAFTGKQQNSQVLIEWSTATEINNDYMLIEHAMDGRHFTEIGKITGAGNSTTVQHYSFKHERPVNGTNYYRLKQVDYDGKFTYHHIIPVAFEGGVGIVSTFPNPANDRINVQLYGWPEGVLSVQVLDMAGRVIEEEQQAASSTISMDIHTLQSGMYFLRISGAERSETIRFKKS